MKQHVRILIGCLIAAAAAVGAGCESHIRPLRPMEQVQVWVPDEAATEPGTQPATQAAEATTAPATLPASVAEATTTTAPGGGHFVTRTVDPNETRRFIYNATYDNVWQQAINVLKSTGFAVDRHDYRLGVLLSQPLPSSQIVEFWSPQHTNVINALENTGNNQRRTARVTISPVPGKPDFYEVGVQVIVERQTNPEEELGGPVFVEGSGFGRNAVSLRSDYAPIKPEAGQWVTLGHDPDMERKLMEALFQRI